MSSEEHKNAFRKFEHPDRNQLSPKISDFYSFFEVWGVWVEFPRIQAINVTKSEFCNIFWGLIFNFRHTFHTWQCNQVVKNGILSPRKKMDQIAVKHQQSVRHKMGLKLSLKSVKTGLKTLNIFEWSVKLTWKLNTFNVSQILNSFVSFGNELKNGP